MLQIYYGRELLAFNSLRLATALHAWLIVLLYIYVRLRCAFAYVMFVKFWGVKFHSFDSFRVGLACWFGHPKSAPFDLALN